MATRPTPGGSDETWGTELNAHLEVSLASDGKIKDGAVLEAATQSGDSDRTVADKAYVDTKATVAFPGSSIAHGAVGSGSIFELVDMSSIVGSNAALISMWVTVTGGDNVWNAAFQGGDESLSFTAIVGSVDMTSSSVWFVNSNTTPGTLLTLTVNSAGKFKMACNDTTPQFTFKVLSYIKA
ncbi:hypothetical protein LCGC14_1901130 [marine sediment metagenome]|uniref:Uncharacterized protein n=1 Tax=marine sediment metagenome TaxID=412755 RepID=A0A0F9IAI1_9ZZZZ